MEESVEDKGDQVGSLEDRRVTRCEGLDCFLYRILVVHAHIGLGWEGSFTWAIVVSSSNSLAMSRVARVFVEGAPTSRELFVWQNVNHQPQAPASAAAMPGTGVKTSLTPPTIREAPNLQKLVASPLEPITPCI